MALLMDFFFFNTDMGLNIKFIYLRLEKICIIIYLMEKTDIPDPITAVTNDQYF
jgi:hypothetical protein